MTFQFSGNVGRPAANHSRSYHHSGARGGRQTLETCHGKTDGINLDQFIEKNVLKFCCHFLGKDS
jgi:hypothetical protein